MALPIAYSEIRKARYDDRGYPTGQEMGRHTPIRVMAGEIRPESQA